MSLLNIGQKHTCVDVCLCESSYELHGMLRWSQEIKIKERDANKENHWSNGDKKGKLCMIIDETWEKKIKRDKKWSVDHDSGR